MNRFSAIYPPGLAQLSCVQYFDLRAQYESSVTSRSRITISPTARDPHPPATPPAPPDPRPLPSAPRSGRAPPAPRRERLAICSARCSSVHRPRRLAPHLAFLLAPPLDDRLLPILPLDRVVRHRRRWRPLPPRKMNLLRTTSAAPPSPRRSRRPGRRSRCTGSGCRTRRTCARALRAPTCPPTAAFHLPSTLAAAGKRYPCARRRRRAAAAESLSGRQHGEREHREAGQSLKSSTHCGEPAAQVHAGSNAGAPCEEAAPVRSSAP